MNKIYVAIGIAFLSACGNSTAPERVHIPSTISAAKCSNGNYSLTANWEASGKWSAVFTTVSGNRLESSPVSEGVKTSSCLFKQGDSVYAILNSVTVLSDNDMTRTLVIQ